MVVILHKELSYSITGYCFKAHRELGRFCRHVQYCDRLEELFKNNSVAYKREIRLDTISDSPKGNIADYIIESKIVLDVKAKRFITKEDYYQMQRYLQGVGLQLGLIVNFRNAFVKPKRVINYSLHSDE